MTVYLTSEWSYSGFTLTDPTGPSVTPSDWSFGEIQLDDPGTQVPSQWSYGQTALRNPHYPLGVLVGGQIRYVPIST